MIWTAVLDRVQLTDSQAGVCPEAKPRLKQSKLLSDVTNSVHYARLTTSRNVAQHWETWHTLLINVNKHRKQQNLILVCEQSAYRRLLVPVFPFCCNVPKLASYLGMRYSTIFECWKAVNSRISWLPVTSKKSQPACHTVMAFTSFRLSRTLKQNCVSKEDIPLIVAATVFLINNWSNWRPVSSKNFRTWEVLPPKLRVTRYDPDNRQQYLFPGVDVSNCSVPWIIRARS